MTRSLILTFAFFLTSQVFAVNSGSGLERTFSCNVEGQYQNKGRVTVEVRSYKPGCEAAYSRKSKLSLSIKKKLI